MHDLRLTSWSGVIVDERAPTGKTRGLPRAFPSRPLPADSLLPSSDALAGRKVRLVGKFVGVPRRETALAVQRRGGAIDDASPDLVVVGEEASESEREQTIADAARSGVECISESELWRRLGLVESDQGVRRLYSPGMLADLIDAPVAAVRRWARRGAIRPACWVQRLAYFDFEEARVAQLLAELLRQGHTLSAIDAHVDRLASAYPAHERPLAELPLVVENGELLIRGEEPLRDVSGQRRLDFDDLQHDDVEEPVVLKLTAAEPQPLGQRELAWRLYDDGRIADAIEAFRLALLESPPTSEDHFVLAEWLYAAGQSMPARERYYAALEVDPEHLEARVSLGCVLSDLGEQELAVAAIRGAIDQHEGYADAHFHLARIHERQGDHGAAEPHWRRFLEIAPESPWAQEARDGLRWGRSDAQT